METIQTLEQQLKIENLKWGLPDINTGHSLEDSIRFIANCPDLKGKEVKIWHSEKPAEMEIAWNPQPPFPHENPSFANSAFITQSPLEIYRHGKRLILRPNGNHLVRIIRRPNKDDLIEYSAEISTMDLHPEFRSRVEKTLGKFPDEWKFRIHSK